MFFWLCVDVTHFFADHEADFDESWWGGGSIPSVDLERFLAENMLSRCLICIINCFLALCRCNTLFRRSWGGFWWKLVSGEGLCHPYTWTCFWPENMLIRCLICIMNCFLGLFVDATHFFAAHEADFDESCRGEGLYHPQTWKGCRPKIC